MKSYKWVLQGCFGEHLAGYITYRSSEVTQEWKQNVAIPTLKTRQTEYPYLAHSAEHGHHGVSLSASQYTNHHYPRVVEIHYPTKRRRRRPNVINLRFGPDRLEFCHQTWHRQPRSTLPRGRKAKRDETPKNEPLPTAALVLPGCATFATSRKIHNACCAIYFNAEECTLNTW
ncbi:hypothetical protein SODALDRAFT_360675 [Sodiomyces alkalinus F11]|uniref:Uncharacterized protein n=1 Tax=Sodiomyces alkalinus (strain CBS 110278 / VKM F-3762 / F11) TaxID=1314773 RepID=A0A3N2PVE3_SODAK|nr:hypothetical protein SODALDRAFT_360675 [Sodiomyces alkalinus F11]ROT38316.1 hypothetical protein SODALDRAFT_360675 [Sodiomyces alkalinus F11]